MMTASIEDWLSLIRGEVLEAPDARFTLTDAQQRWKIDDPALLRAVLDALVTCGALKREEDGHYVATRSG